MMIEKPSITASETSALSVDSSNFETRKVQQVDGDTLRIKPTVFSLAFSLVFIILGLGLVGLWAASTFTAFEGPGSIPLMLIGLLFAAAGLGSYHSSNEQLVINRQIGVAFMRSWHPAASLDLKAVSKHVEAQHIVSIQLISRVVKHRSSRSKRRNSYTEYQVNLCTSAEERHNVFVTLKSEKAENLAAELAELFEVALCSVDSPCVHKKQ